MIFNICADSSCFLLFTNWRRAHCHLFFQFSLLWEESLRYPLSPCFQLLLLLLLTIYFSLSGFGKDWNNFAVHLRASKRGYERSLYFYLSIVSSSEGGDEMRECDKNSNRPSASF